MKSILFALLLVSLLAGAVCVVVFVPSSLTLAQDWFESICHAIEGSTALQGGIAALASSGLVFMIVRRCGKKFLDGLASVLQNLNFNVTCGPEKLVRQVEVTLLVENATLKEKVERQPEIEALKVQVARLEEQKKATEVIQQIIDPLAAARALHEEQMLQLGKKAVAAVNIRTEQLNTLTSNSDSTPENKPAGNI